MPPTVTVDPPGLPAVFVTEAVQIGMIGGVVTISFAELRGLGDPPRPTKVVVARVAMAAKDFDQFRQKLEEFTRATHTMSAPSGPMTSN